jgi:transposase
MRSIVRRDSEEAYQAFLTRLAKASGIETPTRENLAVAPQAQEENVE